MTNTTIPGPSHPPTATPSWKATIPNALTLTRMALAPVAWLLIEGGRPWTAMVVILVGAATDWLDGFLARRWRVTSVLGRQLDPLVDKLIVGGSFIAMLAYPSPATGLRPWMVAVIISRELLVQSLRGMIESKGEAFGARWAGKLKTAFQFAALVAILLVLGLASPPPGLILARDALIWIAVGLTIYSGATYIALAWPHLRGPTAAASTTTPMPEERP
jgi:CDP-diacylglycerol--glycerol-3-phosphate 3-phosphatidyltransferase